MSGTTFTDVVQIVALTAMAGAAIPLGGLVAWLERLPNRWLELEFRHTIIAFGGGALLAAVALVLVPEGARRLSPLAVAAAFATGGGVFLLIDRALARHGTPAALLVAALLDFLPEAMALGAAFAHEHEVGLLLALLIGLQNLPEGFGAYRELASTGRLPPRRVLLTFAALVPLGPVAGLLGLLWLTERPQALGIILLFAAGGILYLVFQDIAPKARLKRAWLPPLGAVLGFLLGLVGQLLLVGHG